LLVRVLVVVVAVAFSVDKHFDFEKFQKKTALALNSWKNFCHGGRQNKEH